VREVAASGRWLGAQVGLLLVLHTWGQTLQHHPHVHGIVSGGGLSCDAHGRVEDAPRWRSCRPGFFLPVRVLGRVFRGKYLALLEQAFEQGKLLGPDRRPRWPSAGAFAAWRKRLQQKEWVVYAKPPFGGPAQVLKYLAGYTHRVALSNHRLLKLEEGRVTFTYKDYAADQRQRTLTLPAEEFLRRFLQHVLPRGFVKIRHYGLLANRHRQQRLEVCRRLLLVQSVRGMLGNAVGAAGGEVEAARPGCCQRCGSRRLLYQELPREAKAAVRVEASDSS